MPLPLPVSVTPPRLRTRLYARARLSNAGLLLLLSSLTLSLLFNVLHHAPRRHFYAPLRLTEAIARANGTRSLKRLIIVPGHAVWIGADPTLRLSEDQWLLEAYQKGPGRLAAFFAHISRGVELAAHDKDALLVFSGGQTKKASTTTEAESYLRLALYSSLFGAPETPNADYMRATTENYALDSYQNLLFSISRFHEYTGRFPENITIIGYEFKRDRFVDLHRAAIRWPLDRFQYIGIDGEDELSLDAQQGEQANGYKPYSSDFSTPELGALLDWCPNSRYSSIFVETLPWDQL